MEKPSIPVNVDISIRELENMEAKVAELQKTIEKAKSLAGEIASSKMTISYQVRHE